MATNQHSTDRLSDHPDAQLQALFSAYQTATKELNERGDIDNPKCPFLIAFNGASDAMREAPTPTTTEGAALLLRFGLAIGAKKEEDAVLLLGSATDRHIYFQQHRENISGNRLHQWAALVALETRQSPQRAPSLIEQLHARYEQAWVEYNALESTEAALITDSVEALSQSLNWKEGMIANARETDALRIAILHQVPTTWPEALILAHHLHNAHDLTDETSSEEKATFQSGLDTLLDFLFGEIDHEPIAGQQMRSMERNVRARRRARTGQVEA